MHIIVAGADYTTASIELRERLSCSSRQIPQVLQAVTKVAQECVVLSTCNRMEVYAVVEEADMGRARLLDVLSEVRSVPYAELDECCYAFTDQQAVSHLFGVASGLYSLVPGEPQIQGQVVEALEIAQGGRYAGPILSALFRAAVKTGKRARSETRISHNAASISHVAVQLARHLLPDFRNASVLLIGSGKMSEIAARNLRDHGARRLVVINRTHQHAIDLAQTLQATHRSFSELADTLVEADVVISSTTAPRAIITAELMQDVMQRRAGRSLLIIDIALPRDVEPSVGLQAGVHLYNVDDLQEEVERGIQQRMQEAEQVRTIIAEEALVFDKWLSSLSIVGTVSDLRQHIDGLRQQELMRTLRQLAPTLSSRDLAAVQELSTRLVNKILHAPTLRLKEAAEIGQGPVYAEAIRYLFNLEENDAAHYDRNASKQACDDTDATDDQTVISALAQS